MPFTPRAALRGLRRRMSIAPIDRGMGQNTVQAPHIAARLNRALGIREMASTPDLNSSIQPVIIVDDVSRDPATDEREAYWAFRVNHTAPAGDGPFVWVRNDSDNAIVTIDWVWFNLVTSGSIGVARAQNSFTAITAAQFMPLGPTPSSGAGVTRSSYCTAGGDTLALSLYPKTLAVKVGGAGAGSELHLQASIAPRESFVFSLDTPGGTIDVSVFFRERLLSQ